MKGRHLSQEQLDRRRDVMYGLVALTAFALLMLWLQGLSEDLRTSNAARDALARQVESLGHSPVAGPPGSRGAPGQSVVGPEGLKAQVGRPGRTRRRSRRVRGRPGRRVRPAGMAVTVLQALRERRAVPGRRPPSPGLRVRLGRPVRQARTAPMALKAPRVTPGRRRRAGPSLTLRAARHHLQLRAGLGWFDALLVHASRLVDSIEGCEVEGREPAGRGAALRRRLHA